MSIQSMYQKSPLFLVPSKRAKAPASQGNNQPPQNLQRSGKLKLKKDVLALPPLLTIKEGEKVEEYQNRCWDYFRRTLCTQPIFTSWGDKVNLTAHRDNSAKKAFEHITVDAKSEIGIGGFSWFRAAYLPWLEPLLSSRSTTWYQAWTKRNCSTNRMIGNLADTHFIAVIQAPKYQGADLSLVTAFPADYSLSEIKKRPIIMNPERYFDQRKKTKQGNERR